MASQLLAFALVVGLFISCAAQAPDTKLAPQRRLRSEEDRTAPAFTWDFTKTIIETSDLEFDCGAYFPSSFVTAVQSIYFSNPIGCSVNATIASETLTALLVGLHSYGPEKIGWRMLGYSQDPCHGLKKLLTVRITCGAMVTPTPIDPSITATPSPTKSPTPAPFTYAVTAFALENTNILLSCGDLNPSARLRNIQATYTSNTGCLAQPTPNLSPRCTG
eukprot:CAMPEP_0184357470 /NCGR_PEP_ID=MMETSP1089-20130417/108967_1 /TAXON_ID=38269 ORGANISM="Gloeochaete wittrockiana, Strain SAG46.84" /NCGR_SAMPLE_ID=MMETSP1089 /ASSEMBLY_ACC=CAM_ASM_000445 /LENGTH=218 /DNA_ID=CAMNT_0026695259 /DNA_START=57 /DNA_END=709 /DNA_ORIENTATION=-